MKPRSAIKTDLFADEQHRKKLDALGDPLADIASHIDFAALAAEVDRVAPRPVSAQGGRPPYPTETMVRILVLKRLYNLSDEQMEYQLLDRMSYKRFCGLETATKVPDRTTVWTFENRIGEAGAQALFEGVSAQLLKKGFIARVGQIIDATWTKKHGFCNQIQRKAHRNKPLSDCQQRRNKRIAKTRARVEHVFGAIDQMGGKLLRTIGQARANFAMTMMAACYNLKRLVYFQKAGIEAF